MVTTSHHSSIVINNIIFIIAAWSWWSNDATNTIFPKTRTWSNRRAGHGGDLGDRPASGRGRDISGDEVDAEIVIWIDWELGCTKKDMEREADMEMYEDRDMDTAQTSVLPLHSNPAMLFGRHSDFHTPDSVCVKIKLKPLPHCNPHHIVSCEQQIAKRCTSEN